MTTLDAAQPSAPDGRADETPGDADALVDAAVSLAGELLAAAEARRTRAERSRQRRFARLLKDPAAIAFTVELTDTVVRVADRGRAARGLAGIVARRGVPAGFGPVDRLALRVGAALAPRVPRLIMPLVAARVRAESHGVVLPSAALRLTRYLARRRRAGIDVNLNVLGEAVLGEEEAGRRLTTVAATLARPGVAYVSVKLSAVASQLNPLAWDHEVERIAGRLRTLYRVAAAASPPRFVNLDMEEYRDLELTMEVFQRVLDEPEFLALEAGIVLQAYLPDSVGALATLTQWAVARRARGGAGIKVRLVKGANLAMERVEAEWHGWPAAPYATKAEVDGNYKRLVEFALRAEHTGAMRVGIASHNLFDVAWAQLLAERRGIATQVEVEMLEGMAGAEVRAVRRRWGRILLYVPVTRRRDFPNAVAYLVRRLDENTAPENYLRAAFSLRPGSAGFAEQADRFRSAVAARHAVATGSRRAGRPPVASGEVFANEPDSDLARPDVRGRMLAALGRWRVCESVDVPLVIDGAEVPVTERRAAMGVDPSDPARVPYRSALADADDVERAVAAAVAAQPAWAARSPASRRAVLDAVADVMVAERADTVGCLAVDAGKTVAEADPEVSEAIDFARYYGRSAVTLAAEVGDIVTGAPVGPVVVAPPWNFPYAIAAGGVLAALAAGNTVILKPAPQTVLTAWLLARQLWRGGVPRRVLQFVPCPDDEVGRRLVTHPDVGAVILTGSVETARLFRSWRPDLALLAETSGKNALVITGAADVDLAVRDLVRSAFGHAGQKCSAASLAIVEAGVYDDPGFRRRLRDAVTSLVVGPAWDAAAAMGPLIDPPSGPLLRALTTLEPGESWLVAPHVDADNPRLWTPGVKLGVAPGSWFHTTECFGPVLGVMRAPDLDTAIAWQNATGFGLTGGIASLDPDELTRWCAGVEVGNAYVNRGITGAIVRRQPFGGWKGSVVGPGAKAGGPDYLVGLQRWRALDDAAWAEPGITADLDRWWAAHLVVDHDPTGLVCERNVFRFRPLGGPVLVVAGARAGRELGVALAAAHRAGASVETIDAADEPAWLRRVRGGGLAKIRAIGPVPPALRIAAHECDVPLDDLPVTPSGRLELLRWVREQSVTVTNHRYGDVGAAAVPDLGAAFPSTA